MNKAPPALRQTPTYSANTNWFHVFNAMFDSEDCKKMGPYAVVVYLAIKRYTNWETGCAFPAIETIANRTGISRRQVILSLGTLVEFGYLQKERRGRANIYRIREKIPILDKNRQPAAVATWDYLPSAVAETRAHLKRLLLTDKVPESDGVIIVENLSLNLQVVNGGSGTQINITVGEIALTPTTKGCS